MTPLTLDLNADLGESDGPTLPESDRALLNLVTSASVACGAHAGNEGIMAATVALAAKNGVTVGAHPGYADRDGFGRRELGLPAEEISGLVLAQVKTLRRICHAERVSLRYVKPHGALYNRAVRDAAAAEAIVRAMVDAGGELVLLGLPGSRMLEAGAAAGLATAREAFIDRGYRPDGTLVPRGEPGALLDNPAIAADRAVRMALEEEVEAADGTSLRMQADSFCVHGDGAGAVALLAEVRRRLLAAGVHLAPFAR